MAEERQMCDSDESDEDYVPTEQLSDAPSEEESDGVDEEIVCEDLEDGPSSRKRRRKCKTERKHRKASENRETKELGEKHVQKEVSEEDAKKKADSLWSDFLKDTNTATSVSKTKASNGHLSGTADSSTKSKPSIKDVDNQPEKHSKNTKIFEFAGEVVRVEGASSAAKDVVGLSTSHINSASVKGGGNVKPAAGGRGLSNILGTLGKKVKLGTLEKSKLDWDRFKRAEGLCEELESHNKGKDGYLAKRDFLERADLRQFELEKEMRSRRGK